MSPRPDLGPKPRLGYAGTGIERAAERRRDPAAMALLTSHPEARSYLVSGEIVILHPVDGGIDPLFTLAEVKEIGPQTETAFLGLLDGAPRFATALAADVIERLKTRSDITLSDLRSIATRGLVDPVHLPPLAEGKALLGWHSRHRFCANCGAATMLVESGWRRDCPACSSQHFPRTDPVVIMLVTDGERCLLGRSHRFQPGMWSCLAGFVEPGETIEDAVRREVREETSIVCGRVGYCLSQPWPFPSSLMIGCRARAITNDIVVDQSELADARWFDREELASMLARRHPDGLSAPHPVAVAYHLIRDWVENGWVEDAVDAGA
jgi:NAD+ diphosphatase